MGTRCYICVELTDEQKKKLHTEKQFYGVYCALNGMIEGGVGETLYVHYHTNSKAFRLVKHGDIHVLGNLIKETQFLNTHYSECVTFNEEDINNTFGFMIQYVYLHRLNGGWEVRTSTPRNRYQQRGFLYNRAAFSNLIKRPIKKRFFFLNAKDYHNRT